MTPIMHTGATPKAQAPTAVLTLPYPPPALSQNARGHWALRYRAGQDYGEHCWALARVQYERLGWRSLRPPVEVAITMRAPDRRKRDIDNLFAALKVAFDAAVRAGLLSEDTGAALRYRRVSMEVAERRADPPEEPGIVVELYEAEAGTDAARR